MTGLLRVFIKLGLVLTIVLGVLAAGLRVLAYDYVYFDELRAFLVAPENCPMPCFVGIRPGVTTKAEAVAILQANAQAEDLVIRDAMLVWWWDSRVTAGAEGDERFLASLHVDMNGIVKQIQVITLVPLVDTLIVLGEPQRGYFNRFYTAGVTSEAIRVVHSSLYDDKHLEVRVSLLCGVPLWQMPVTMVWWDTAPLYEAYLRPLHPDNAMC